MKLDIDVVKEIFNESGLSFFLRKSNSEYWNDIILNLKYVPISYTIKSLEYENYYSFSNSKDYLDISIIITSNNIAVGIWPLTLSLKHKDFDLTSQGQKILSPIFLENVNIKERKKLYLKCYNSLKSLCNKYKVKEIKSLDIFVDKQINSVSDWHLLFLNDNAEISVNYAMFAYLSDGIEKYRKNIRKSYKPLINQGLKFWTVRKLFNENKLVWLEFKKLHFKVSGSKTRSEETWQRQYQSILIGEAFLIYLLNDNNEMIGGAYFTLSKNEAVYSIGAYDRKLFDKPIGHVIQYVAIEEFIQRKIDWYKIGLITNDKNKISEKNKSIQVFKNGFSSHIMPEYCLNINL